MPRSSKQFAELLQRGVDAIAKHTNKPKGVVRDELGYAIGRKGGSAIEYWAYGDGRIPRQQADVAKLARYLVDAAQMSRAWLDSFLASAGYPDRDELAAELFPDVQEQPTNNLPVDTTPFVGRKAELAELANLITNPDCRLITLVGPGGSGKTRLAIAAARGANAAFVDGAVFVALAPISSPDLIASTVATTLNLTLERQSTPQSQVLRYLRRRKLLLVLDNFEHLLAMPVEQTDENSALPLLIDILQQAADVTMLVTSRERLNLQGEWLYDVAGLETPTEETTVLSGDSAVTASAPALFVQTARRLRSDFAPTLDEQAAIRRICRLVNGMPLAIELAASWVRMFSCTGIANEIEESLGFLSTTLHDIPARHRSMQAVFDHSWKLLRKEEQAVFARCSVFRGGFTREAAQDITGATLPILAALVDKSLLNCSQDGRYSVHELARQYAAHRLDESEETAATRNRHLAFFAQLSEEAEPRIRSGPQCAIWHDRIEREHDNIRAALDWSYAEGELELGFRIAGTVWEFWMNRNHWGEGQAQAERFLNRTDASVLPALRAKVLHTAGVCAFYIGRHTTALTWLWECEAISRKLGTEGKYPLALALTAQGYTFSSLQDPEALQICGKEILALGHDLKDEWVQGHAWNLLGRVEQIRGNRRQACEHFPASVTCFWTDGEGVMCGAASMRLGKTLYEDGNYAAAYTHLTRALAVFEDLKDRNRASTILRILGYRALALSALDDAQEMLLTALVQVRQTGHVPDLIKSLDALGRVLQRQGDYHRAYTQHREALLLAVETEHSVFIPLSLEGFACLAAAQGEAQRAAILFGAAETSEELDGVLSDPHLRAEHDRLVASVRDELGERAFDASWRKGSEMTLEQATDFALERMAERTQITKPLH